MAIDTIAFKKKRLKAVRLQNHIKEVGNYYMQSLRTTHGHSEILNAITSFPFCIQMQA